MNRQIIENKLNKIINECIQDAIYEQNRQIVRKLVSEEYYKRLSLLKESDDNENESDEEKQKRSTVMSMLKNDIVNHAPLAYKLWGDSMSKDACRSLFSKKLNGTPDDDGQVRTFTTLEINKLYDMLRQRK